jgi:putative nucleotidyltransferase with HDIG domain
MRKSIGINELRLGMFIQSFGGSWISHPFWRENFLLSTDEDLSRIRTAGVKEIFIDTSKGLDVASRDQPDQQHQQVLAPVALQMKPAAAMQVSFDDELVRAQKICLHSKSAIAAMFQDARMGVAISSDKVNGLVEEISASVLRNPNALISLVRLKNADEYTFMHSVAVCALMIALARQMNLSEELVREAGVAGLLHDIGKMAIPDEILNKPGKLSDEEFEIIRNHPVAGIEMLNAGAVSPYVMEVCLQHHEKVDGSGYPHGLTGDALSLFARMGSVCDVYDAITSNRCYHRAWDAAEAIRRMADWEGHFDENVFQAFVKAVGIYPVGTLVRLESGRLAVVIEQHKKSLLTPKVKIFMSVRSRLPIMQETIDLAKFVGSDKIVAIESPGDWGISQLNAVWLGDAMPT